MEKAGLAQSLKFLNDRGLAVDVLITDRHPQVQKYLRESAPSIRHHYDVWHVAKGTLSFTACRVILGIGSSLNIETSIKCNVELFLR